MYREWAAVAIDDEEEEEDEDDLIEEGPTVYEREHGQGGFCIPITASKRESDDDELGASFGGMSISPAQTRTVAMAISVS